MSRVERRRTLVAEPEAPVMVVVEGISKHFGDVRALDGVSFQIRKGEIVGFLGPNGAGKTTTMRVLSGYFPPSKGKVWIGGKELFKNPQETKALIGYLPESASFYGDMKVSEFLRFVANVKGVSFRARRESLEEIMDRCGLWEVKKRLIKNLSKGYRQRVGIAQALVNDPEVLLLDEPTSGLDPKQIKEIRSLMRELGRERTLILSTHILPEVSMVCDRVLIFNEGKIIADGTVDELAAGLQTSHEIFVAMGERHRKDEVLDEIRKLPGIEKASVVEEKGDSVSLLLLVAKGRELRPEITRLFVQRQVPLLELRYGKLSLEEIFLKIVVNEELGQA